MSTHDWIADVGEMLLARVDGPLSLRIMLQPAVAVILAIRSGLRDAREGRSPYFFWKVFGNPGDRSVLLRMMFKDVGKVFVIAFVLDMVYGWVIDRRVYPGQAVIIATVLAIVPYLMIRGPVSRLAYRLQHP